MTAGIKRNKFTREEDKKLTKLVRTYGEKNWKTIAKIMVDRNERQCRERWRYFLSPKVQNKKCWTVEEDDLLLLKYAEIGPKWSTLSKFFKKRSDISVKNRYHILIRENQKNLYTNQDESNHKSSHSRGKNEAIQSSFNESQNASAENKQTSYAVNIQNGINSSSSIPTLFPPIQQCFPSYPTDISFNNSYNGQFFNCSYNSSPQVSMDSSSNISRNDASNYNEISNINEHEHTNHNNAKKNSMSIQNLMNDIDSSLSEDNNSHYENLYDLVQSEKPRIIIDFPSPISLLNA